MDLRQAARVGDPIRHSHASVGAVLGAGIGLGAGAVAGSFAFRALGLGAVELGVDITELGAFLGELVGSSFSDDGAGCIALGAASVFVGDGMPAAARIEDPLACGDAGSGTARAAVTLFGLFNPFVLAAMAPSDPCAVSKGGMPGSHPRALVAGGVDAVLIEGLRCARAGDGTSCGGCIARGSHSVLIGGTQGGLAGTEARDELSPSLRIGLEVLDGVGTGAGLLAVSHAMTRRGRS
jgi:uncharacterized Zn-binding protein involved in type VI secretion